MFLDAKGKYWTDPLDKWKPTVTVYSHCELVLALYLLHLPLPPESIELGVSKACCWPCVVLLELLAQHMPVTIMVSGTHSKTYRGWQYPPAVPDRVRDVVRDQLLVKARMRIDTFLGDLYDRRRASDSQYHSSGDEDDSDVEKIISARVRV